MNRIYFDQDDARFTECAWLWGVGHRELMPRGFVSRARGLSAYLAVLFHDAAEVELRSEWSKVAPESLVIWDLNRPHRFGRHTNAWTHSWVVFGGSEWHSIVRRLKLSAHFERPLIIKGRAHLQNYFRNILEEVSDEMKPDLEVIIGNIELLLREFVRGNVDASETKKRSDRIRLACEFVRTNLHEPMSVARVAEATGVSPSRLQQLFRERLGMSVRDHIEREKLQEARYWLMHSGLRVREIADAVGIHDAFYFSRRFRWMFGESPLGYRKKQFGSVRPPNRPLEASSATEP